MFQLLQICDSAFPIGAYAHSNGCEANFQLGLFHGKDELKEFLQKCIGNEANQRLPFVREAWKNAPNFDAILVLDHLLDVTLSNHVNNRSSSQLGRAMIEASKLSFKLPNADQLLKAIDCYTTAGHFAIIFGIVGSHINLTIQETLTAYIFAFIRDVVSAAVRLDIISCMEALALQSELWDFALKKISQSMTISVHETSIVHPVTDLVAGAHTRLFSRLFQS